MKINPYLGFNGQCKEAFEFYAHVLSGEIVLMMTYGESPAAEHTPVDQHDRILHVSLKAGDNTIMGGDAPPAYFSQPQGFSVSITTNSTEKSKGIFDALTQGGVVKMPFEKTFWSEGFGMTLDKFGIPWMVSTDPAASS